MLTDIGPRARKGRTKPSRITGRKIESTNHYQEYSAKQLVLFAIGRFVRGG